MWSHVGILISLWVVLIYTVFCSHEFNAENVKMDHSVRHKLILRDETTKPAWKKSSRSGKPNKWSNATVYYQFSESFSADQKFAIRFVLNIVQNATCERFMERTSEENYTMFNPGPTCASHVGMQGGRQTVFLAKGCFTNARIARQILHLLGFHAELNRPDRDMYLDINWSYIKPGLRRVFYWYPEESYLTLSAPFDFHSASFFDKSMNYGVDPSQWTVRPKNSSTTTLGNESGFSVLDLHKINKVYCDKKETR